MKTRKILDLTPHLTLVVRDNDIHFEFDGEPDNDVLTLEDLKQLRDWLTNEVFKDNQEMSRTTIVSTEPLMTSGFTGPVIVNPGQKIPTSDLENRRAAQTSNGPIPAGALPVNLGLKVENLSMDLSKAREAFSPAHIYDGGEGNK